VLLNWLRIIFCDSFDGTVSISACVVSVGSMMDGWMVNCKGFGRRWLWAHQHYILVLSWRDMKSMRKVVVADG
jgi:hypothetical protein